MSFYSVKGTSLTGISIDMYGTGKCLGQVPKKKRHFSPNLGPVLIYLPYTSALLEENTEEHTWKEKAFFKIGVLSVGFTSLRLPVN